MQHLSKQTRFLQSILGLTTRQPSRQRVSRSKVRKFCKCRTSNFQPCDRNLVRRLTAAHIHRTRSRNSDSCHQSRQSKYRQWFRRYYNQNLEFRDRKTQGKNLEGKGRVFSFELKSSKFTILNSKFLIPNFRCLGA